MQEDSREKWIGKMVSIDPSRYEYMEGLIDPAVGKPLLVGVVTAFDRWDEYVIVSTPGQEPNEQRVHISALSEQVPTPNERIITDWGNNVTFTFTTSSTGTLGSVNIVAGNTKSTSSP